MRDVVAFLSQAFRLRRTVAAGLFARTVVWCSSEGELLRRAQATPFAPVVLDPTLVRDESFVEVLQALTERPRAVLLYCDPGLAAAERILRAASVCSFELLLAGTDDDSHLVRRRLAWRGASSVQAMVLRLVAHNIGDVPANLRPHVLSLFGSSQVSRHFADSHVGLGVSRRTVERWLDQAGFNGHSRMIRGAQLARAWDALVESAGDLGAARVAASYSSERTMYDHFKRVLGCSPSRALSALRQPDVALAVSKYIVKPATGGQLRSVRRDWANVDSE